MKNRIKNFFPSLNFSSPFLTSVFPLLLPFLTFFLASVASAQIPSTGLVGYWPFNGNANDESGNGNSGTVNGATLTADRFGNANSAYSFNGATHEIVVPNSPSLNFEPANAFTISYWISVSNIVQNAENFVLIKQVSGGTQQDGYNSSVTTFNSSSCRIQNGLSTPSFTFSTAANSIPIQTWIFVCQVWDGSHGKTYHNSMLVNDAIGSAVVGNNSSDLRFGRPEVVSSSGQGLNGKIDDISMYNRALTPAEITQLYTDPSVIPPVACAPFLGEDQTVCAGTSVTLSASGSTLACPTLPSTLQNGLVGYWPFCGNANDASGNGNNGTVNGATLTTDRFGNANSAYRFEQTGTIQNISIGISDGDSPFLNAGYSYSFWMNSQSASLGRVFQQTGQNNKNFDFVRSEVNEPINSYAFWHYDVGTQAVSPQTLLSNNWYHVAIVIRDNNLVDIFLDGQYWFTGNYSFPKPNGGVLMLASQSNNYFGFSGMLDDVALHNRALSASEIQQLYTLGQSTYLWSTGATTASISVTPTQTTTYTCTVTDANGNACTDSVTVFVPQITATNSTICAGQSTTLSVSGINSTATPTACPTLPSNLQTGLVGYWPFCGNANDASGNGNNGTVNGATLTTDRFGNANRAFSLSGTSNSILVNDSPSLDFPQGVFSLCAEVKLSGLGVEQGLIDHLDVGGPSVLSRYTLRVLPNNKIRFNLKDDENDWSSVDSDISLDINVWYSIVGVFNYATQELHIYINGEIHDGTIIYNSLTGPAITPPNSLILGNFAGAYNLNGTIDNVSIYNRALSASEIQQLYTLGQTTYLWSTGATTATINVSPTVTTTYTCTVTTNGVSCTDSVTVVVNNPTIDLGSDVTACGISTTLTAPTGYDSYAWSNGGTTNTTTVTANGTYTCTVTQDGCSASDAVDVTLVDATISATDSVICAGETTTLSVPQGGSSNTACAALPANLQNGLVGYWPFCGNANDASGNGNHMSNNGAVLTTDRFGNVGQSYMFNGAQWMQSSSSQFNGLNQFSMAFWCKSNFLNNNTEYIIHKGCENPTSQGVSFRMAKSDVLWGDNWTNSNGRVWCNSTQASDVSWHHVVMIYNNQSITIYIDGILNAQSNQFGDLSTNSSPLYLATKVADVGCNKALFYNGKLDDVTLHNRALTLAEIQQLYTLGQTTYLWSNGATTPTINVSPISTTTYTCTVTTNGVSCTDSVTVVVNNPTINLGSDVTVCGTSTTLAAPTGYDSYAWSNGGTTNTTTVTANGTYTCTVTQGGCIASDAVDVTLINATISATDSVICAGESTTLSVPQGGSSSTACPTLPFNLQTGLVGYWPFCGNANDFSGNGNNGTVNGATLTTDRYGNANSAYSFDGVNDNVIVPNSVQFQTNTWTINAWFKTSFLGYNRISSKDGVDVASNDFSLIILNGNLYISASLNGVTNSPFPICTEFVADDTWHNVNATRSNGYFQISIDGIFCSSVPDNFGNLINSNSLYIGSPSSYPTQYFNGKLDDLAIYNRALTAAEIQQLYTLGQTTYFWSNGATTPTINVSPTTTTTYTCTVTTNGVSCTDSVTVVVNNPTLDLGSDVTACGTSTTLTAPTGYDSYAWSNGGTTNTTTVTANGTYTCTFNQGGCSANDAVDVTLIDATISATDSVICAGETTTLSVPQGGSSNTACAALPANLQNGLVGYWPFCGNADDASGNGNNGTVNGATLTTDRFGNANSAYSFNGVSSVINIYNSTNLSFPNNITIGAWVYRQSNSTLPEGIFGPATYLPNQPGYFLRVIDNKLNLSISQPYVGGQSNQLISSGQWYFVSGTYDNNSIKTYVNGILSGETVVGSGYLDSWASSNPLTIGQEIDYASTNLHPWNGSLDDIGIWNRSLTVDEIQQIFGQNATTYLWSTGATTPTINVSPATTTTYTCTVTTNGMSCTDTITVVVGNPVASITPNGIVEICQGQSIALTGNGGVSYLWNTGAPTQSITVNTEALYTVTVTDANGCTDTESQLVKVNFLPNIGVNNASICAGQSATLTASGGVSYVWSPAIGLSSTTGSAVTASPSISTVYTVTVTGANGCTNTATAAVAVNALPTATITPASATTFCQGGSVVLNANAGTGLTYQWKLNGTNITGATSSSYTANASGSYTVVVTNTSTCSSTSTTTVVTVNALPTATITASSATTFCQGGSVVLNANTGAGLTYQWRLNGNPISGATSSSYTANASGSYTVVVTNASSCSSTSTSTAVTVNALPTATITTASATTFCQGGSVVLNANTGAGLTYQWFNNASPISGATNASYTATTSGSYTVVVTNASSCSSTSTAVVVTVNALPAATITPATATTFCQGGSVVLNANTGTGLTYQWFNNASAISGVTSASYTATMSGSYTVTVTNASTCSTTSTAVVVTVNALPTATITPATATTFCQGGSVVLNANTGTGLTYQWKLNGTNITGATSSSYTANASGSYTVVVTNASTCSSTSTATVVTVNALPTGTITPASATTFCQGGSAVLNSNTGTGLTYQWFNNATAISGATSASYTATTSGSYTVVVTNASTCSSTSTAVVVTVNALPTATITPASATTFCQGGSVVLNANTGTGLTYQWFNNATAISGATSASYTATTSGSYTVTVTNASACSSTSTATVVTVNALPTATITAATATTFCQGGSVVLNANTGTGLTYQWFNNATAISGATSASYTATTSGSYTVTVTNASACSSTSTATVVTVNALPTATITAATATTFCQGGSVVLNANTGTGLTYQWKLNGTNITGATSSSYTANASGSYTVVVTNTSACSSTSTATIVTVNALPIATITPATATTFCQGGSVVLNANTGTGLSYQWFNNATAISGATSASYTATTSGSYTVVVTNASTCSSTSTATVVTVNALPTATITAVTATTFCQGGSVVLNANTGTGLTYQWKLNGTNITGATSSSYTANASGSYTVVVTNASTCSSTSSATVVTVNALPTATITAATATTFCEGGSVVLNANTGTGLSYQWFNNAIAIGGETTSSYTATASGTYSVVVTNNLNCSTTSSAINVTAVPNVDYYADADGDGFGDLTTLISTCVQPQGYVTDNTDCKDNDASIFPGAQEVCNDIDDDCNDLIDDGLVFMTYYADADGDSFGDVNNTLDACLLPDGYVTNNTDCNDSNANQNAASPEICNGEDDDCDGAIDNGLVFLDYYADLDSDGFGAGAATNSCVDLGAGYVTNNTDCNNANALINPNATEICNDIDDNCDGQIDEGITFTTYYQDFDNDGFGTGDAVTSCTNPGAGWVTNNTDCDDTNGNTNPNATETCNTIDDNCDGQIDEGVQTVYFIDNDGDTYGNPSVSILACTQPIGYTPDDTDCNDNDANINPGAEDIGANGIDENCDGEIDNSIFELNATISLYPNPTRSELNIQVNSSIIGNDLYIYDAVGKLVFKQQLLSTQTILPVSNFADGNYVVRIGEVVKRFVVEK